MFLFVLGKTNLIYSKIVALKIDFNKKKLVMLNNLLPENLKIMKLNGFNLL